MILMLAAAGLALRPAADIPIPARDKLSTLQLAKIPLPAYRAQTMERTSE